MRMSLKSNIQKGGILRLMNDCELMQNPMKVCFIHSGGDSMASFRYRCKMPAKYLNSQGVETFLNCGEANVVVFTKPTQEDDDLASFMKDQGATIIFDIGDPHFEHPRLGPIYESMLARADLIVTPTEFTKNLINEKGRDAVVIPDPYEFEQLAPHAEGEKFLWFGHETNTKDIKSIVDVFGDNGLRIITGPSKVPETTFYSPQNLKRGLEESNIALFPTSKGSEYKSNNRLINAVMSGLFPVCSNHPAYEEFKMFWVGEINTGIRWAKHYKSDLNDLVAEGQSYIKETYSPEIVGAKWLNLLESI